MHHQSIKTKQLFPSSLLCRLAIFHLVVPLISSLYLVATVCSVWSMYCPSFLPAVCPTHFHCVLHSCLLYVRPTSISVSFIPACCMSDPLPFLCLSFLPAVCPTHFHFCVLHSCLMYVRPTSIVSFIPACCMSDPLPFLFQCVFHNVSYLCSFQDISAWCFNVCCIMSVIFVLFKISQHGVSMCVA